METVIFATTSEGVLNALPSSLVILVAAFFSAFLGCVQAINVVKGRRIAAGFTSTAIAVSQLTLYKTVPDVEGWLAIVAFVVGGVIGSQLSMGVTWKRKSTSTN